MKTSKKILSFFLAVVMVVTTCSVGFTAFGAEKNKSIWTTDVDAQTAFDSLNGLADDFLPSLLMGLVGDGVYNKIAREMGKAADQLSEHEKAVIAGDENKSADDDAALRAATLKDILQALQPTLIGALKGTSQGSFVTDILGEPASNISHYDYLNQRTAGGLDYFSLVGICEKYINNGNLSASTRNTLKEWLFGKTDGSETDYTDDSLWSLVSLYNDAAAAENAKLDVILEIADQYIEAEGEDISEACLYALKNFDFTITDEQQPIVDAYIASMAKDIAGYNVGVEIKDFADLLYYGFGKGFTGYIKAAYYINLILAGGGSTDINGSYDLTGVFGEMDYDIKGITSTNFVDKIIDASLDAFGMTMAELAEDEGIPEEYMRSIIASLVPSYYLQQVIFQTTDSVDSNTSSYLADSPYYITVLKGLAVTYGDTTNAAIDSAVNSKAMSTALTDDDFAELAVTIAGRSGNDIIQDYLLNGSCTYSPSSGVDITATLPAALKNTSTAQYFAKLLKESGNQNYVDSFLKSFIGPNILTPVYEKDIESIGAFEAKNTNYAEFFTVLKDGKNAGEIVNNTILSEDKYTITEAADGTVVLKLSPEYLDSLSSGVQYRIQVRLCTGFDRRNFRQYTTTDTFDISFDYLKNSNGNLILANRATDVDAFNSYVEDAKTYAYVQEIADILGITKLDYNQNIGLPSIIDVESFVSEQASGGSEEVTVELTPEQLAVLNGDYPLDNDMGTEIVNYILNDTVGGIVDPNTTVGGIVGNLINGMLDGEADLQAALDNVWKRLCDDTVGTIFELLPLVVSLLDSLVIPLVVNDEGDNTYKTLEDILNLELLSAFINNFYFHALSLEYGSNIGICQIGWDLNVLLPQVMDWIISSAQDKKDKNVPGIEYYDGSTRVRSTLSFDENGDAAVDNDGNFIPTPILTNAADVNTADMKSYTVIDQNGNELSRNDGDSGTTFSYLGVTDESLDVVLEGHDDSVFTYYMTYESDVPYLTGVYIVDKALKDVDIDDLYRLLPEKLGEDAGTILAEVIDEFANLFETAVDTYIDEGYVNETKYNSKGEKVASGLNNLFVAIPRLFDIMDDLAAEKFNGGKSDWVYCYDGRISQTTTVNGDTSTRNALLEKFKSYAASNDSNRKYDILDCFAEVFVENWLNAILALANVAFTGDNDIANSLPIISGLLNALGGFGEKSIITDVINSVFQITRESDYSFNFTDELSNENNKLTGFTKNNAFFLLSNVDRLIEVVKNLIKHFGSNEPAAASVNGVVSGSESAPVVFSASASSAAKAPAAKATSAKYSSSDLSNAKDLIKNLDKMLSSLLSDSTLNDLALNSSENIIAGIVSLLGRFLSDDIRLDNELVSDIVRLVNSYLCYGTGKSTSLVAKDNKVNPKKAYSNDALTGLVVETYALIEKIADRALLKFYDTYDNDATLRYNLLVEAIDGVISPDAIAIRLDDYKDAQKKISKYASWTIMSEDSSRVKFKNLSIDWGIKAGDKEAFYDGLSSALRLVTSILGVLLIDTGWYGTVVAPVLGALCDKNGVEVMSYDELLADKEATGYYDKTLIAVLSAFSGWVDAVLQAPASALIKSVQGVAGILDDNNKKAGTIASIVNGALAPIVGELKGAASIFSQVPDPENGLKDTSSSLAELINGFAAKLDTYSDVNNIKIKDISLSGNNLIPIANSALANTGIVLKQISWSKIYSSSPEAALVYVVEYLFENLLDNDTLTAIAQLIASGNEDAAELITTIFDAIIAGKISAKDILHILNRVLEASDSPTLAYWTFAQYLQELTESFKYPAGITKAMADEGVVTLDNLVANIFPLLSSFGVNLGADDLKGIVDKNLFTNKMLTTIATAIYGALDGLDPTVKDVLKAVGIVTSTKDVAKILTDKSYGATYSSAAKTIKAQSSWKDVKNVNWGFTDGSSKAQQGFVNGLVAILRPLDDILAIFLNEGSLHIDDTLYGVLCALNIKDSTTLEISGNIIAKINYTIKNGVLTVVIDDAVRKLAKSSTIKIDFKSIKTIDDLKIVGTNGYNSAIIPILEAFKCSGIKSYAQYTKDVKNAKDNLLLDILNPILGSSSNSLINKLLDKPFAVVCDLLPNIAMFLDAHGLSQAINNLLAPITGLIADINSVINIDKIVKTATGSSLSELVSDLLGGLLGTDLKIKIDLSDLSSLNIEDLIYPILTTVLKNVDNPIVKSLKLYKIDFNALISLGTKSTYTSKATGANGNYLIGKTLTSVDQGKVLITVLRYVAKTLIANTSALKSLLLGIDAIKKNDIISGIVTSVLNTLSTASPDQLVAAIFYLAAGTPRNAFWDYTSYETGNYTFAYPEGMDVDFLKNLPPMLDGLISGLLDLNGLIGEKLFTDNLISKLATGLYGAVEGVKINDNLTLTSLLAQTGIDFSTTNVANLLVDKAYGQTFEGAAATIRNAGSWKNVNADSLKWGVTDRDSFFHALVAVLRPIYGVLDVLLNDAYLGLFDLVRIPGSNGYTSSIVPLMEAFSMYNIKTQYQYRQDMTKEYDAILLDIINPLWDKVEDILNAPIQTVAAVIPNLALFIGNDGLCQIIDNLLTPVSALADTIRPVIDLNDLLTTLFKALKFDLNGLLAKIGVTNFSLDVYDLNKTLKPVLGGDAIIPLVNSVLGLIKIKGTPLGLKLNAVDWLQLASHGTTIVSASQAATYGARIFVEGDSSETLIAILRYLIQTINAGENFDKINALISGLLGDNVSDSISDVINQVLGMLQGDTDEVISSLVDLLQTLA